MTGRMYWRSVAVAGRLEGWVDDILIEQRALGPREIEAWART